MVRRILMVLVAVVFVCACPFALNRIWNDVRNQEFANQLYKYPLPAHTEQVSYDAKCFCPINGGTCDKNFGMMLSTSLSQQEIQDYYARLQFFPLQRHTAIPLEYDMEPVSLDFDYPKLKEGRIKVRASIGASFYHSGLFDWRCTFFDPTY